MNENRPNDPKSTHGKLTDQRTRAIQLKQAASAQKTQRSQDRQARKDRRDCLKQQPHGPTHSQIQSKLLVSTDVCRKSQDTTVNDHPSTDTNSPDANKASTSKKPQCRGASPTTGIAPQKIIKRRIFGKQMKYKVQVDNDFEWLEASKIDQSLLSAYNVKRYQQMQAKKNRKTLDFNQG